jgi:hypothetical protein
VSTPFGPRPSPENEVKTMIYVTRPTVAIATRRKPVRCYFIDINNGAGRRRRCPCGLDSRALAPHSVRRGQTKNPFGDRALTDTKAAFSLARNGAGVPAIARIVTACFLRRARSRAAPQQAPKHAR